MKKGNGRNRVFRMIGTVLAVAACTVSLAGCSVSDGMAGIRNQFSSIKNKADGLPENPDMDGVVKSGRS